MMEAERFSSVGSVHPPPSVSSRFFRSRGIPNDQDSASRTLTLPLN
jgi:hypothetical protein